MTDLPVLPTPVLPPSLPAVPVFWIALFLIVAYGMGLACLCLALRIGSVGGWRRGLREIALLVFFCGIGFVVESWAHARTPYYFYAEQFPDRVPRIRFDTYPWFPKPLETECLTFVTTHLHTTLAAREIPLAIPILEGSLAFVALWTSRLLGGALLLRPLVAGLALVTVDALLDPIVASTYDCQGHRVREGLGFWNWHIDPTVIAQWYGIPLFNYAGWFAAAVLLVSLAYLIGWGLDLGWWGLPQLLRRAPAGERPAMHRGGLWFLAVAAPAFVIHVAPGHHPPPVWAQWLLVPAVIGGAAAIVALHARRFATAWEEVLDLTRAFLLPLVFALFALAISGQFVRSPGFLYVAVMLAALGLLLAWWPYQSTVQRLAVWLVHVDRFIRLHYVAYPWLLIVLGAGFAAGAPMTGGRLGALLAIGLCFQIYSCVMNDVIDLEIDRTQVRRRNDPLVRGDIDRATAQVFALVQVPVMLLLSQLVAPNRLGPMFLLLGACGLMAVYNHWGKRCPVPPLTDLLQGIAWGLLALYAADVCGAGAPIPAIAFAYGAAFMTMINGVHGGLRDLANDLRWRCTNTARFLGAHSTTDPFVTVSNWRVTAFAFAIQTAMVGMLLWVLVALELPYYAPTSGAAIVAGDAPYAWIRAAVLAAFAADAIWCHVLLWRLVRPGRAERDAYGSMHAFAILLLAVIVFTPALPPLLQAVLLLGFFLPLLVQYVDPIVGSVFPALRGRVANEVPEVRGGGALRWSDIQTDAPLVVVDEQGHALRPETRAACHRGEGILHRAFSVYLFDRGGRLLLQQRSPVKQLWPSYWSNSCCSHPRWGEDIDAAAARRVAEELGCRPALHPLFSFRYQARYRGRGSERELCTVYVGIADAVSAIDPDEIADTRFIDPAELDGELVRNRDAYTPWLRMGWQRLRARHWAQVVALVGGPSGPNGGIDAPSNGNGNGAASRP